MKNIENISERSKNKESKTCEYERIYFECKTFKLYINNRYTVLD